MRRLNVVVRDDLVYNTTLRVSLESHGHNVQTFEKEREDERALEYLLTEPGKSKTDLVITDMGWEDLPAYKFIIGIRRSGNDVPIVIYSQYPPNEWLNQGKILTAYPKMYYLEKPFLLPGELFRIMEHETGIPFEDLL